MDSPQRQLTVTGSFAPRRILVVGLGSIGMRHARVLRTLAPNAEIVALRHQPTADERALPVDRFVWSMDAALDFAPDLAVVANPAPFHVQAALPLIQANVHTLIEKPVSASYADAGALIDACRATSAMVTVGYNLRSARSLQVFRRFLQDGRIGALRVVHAEVGQYLPSWRPATDYRRSVSANASLGGGVLLELSHEIDYLQWLFGDIVWVSAFLLRQSRLEIDVEDTVVMNVGFAAPHGAGTVGRVSLDFIRHDRTRSCVAIGENGSLRWNALTGVVDVFNAGSQGWAELFCHQPNADETYVDQWTSFFAAISSGASLSVSMADAVSVMKVIEGARRSSADGGRQQWI